MGQHSRNFFVKIFGKPYENMSNLVLPLRNNNEFFFTKVHIVDT